jgi:hypothetical protein
MSSLLTIRGWLARSIAQRTTSNTIAQFASRKSAAFFLKAQWSAFSFHFHGGTTVPLSAGDFRRGGLWFDATPSDHRPVMAAHRQRFASDEKIQGLLPEASYLDNARGSAMKRRDKLPLSWPFSHINLPLGWQAGYKKSNKTKKKGFARKTEENKNKTEGCC